MDELMIVEAELRGPRSTGGRKSVMQGDKALAAFANGLRRELSTPR
jgi:hypothetical protein